MKLDKRMTAILTELPPNKNLADIGADHGYIGINYALHNANSIVVGSDISKKSIQKAEQTARKLKLKNYITKVGDGLLPISDFDIDVVLISGMGGEEIIKILSEGKKYSMYVLSPQKNTDKVRKFLSENNLKPIKDYKLFSEGKFYDIIVAIWGEYSPSEGELLFGSGEGEDFLKYADRSKKLLQSLVETVSDNEKKQAILHKLELLNGMLSK